ncbi:hypothetical protein [Saccharopolyspora pogona]|uniref:hypothetical protein n=1 Tax=Saccharopolyspora pogona TaxID=333966 RepID=UPI0016829A21|nr:hypothetical protein [Saccharopolyspora pogona]
MKMLKNRTANSRGRAENTSKEKLARSGIPMLTMADAARLVTDGSRGSRARQ